ncbi:hypothetical protein OAG24_00350 [bacterium]|nr:hypothetical protein [bacterium]
MATPRQKASIEKIRNILSEEYPHFKTKNFDHKKETVFFDFTCENCNTSNLNVSYKNFKSRKAKCKVCDKVQVGTKPLSVENFKEILKEGGWEYDDEDSAYKNTKSLCFVLTDDGERMKTSCNRFKAGHRSKSQSIRSQTASYDEVAKKFKDKGFKLLEDRYVNKSTPMKYECKCGGSSTLRYENLEKTIIGCMECVKKHRSAWQKIVRTFENESFELITTEDQYTNNRTRIEYVCLCGTIINTTWKSFFVHGVRCKKCFKKADQ